MVSWGDCDLHRGDLGRRLLGDLGDHFDEKVCHLLIDKKETFFSPVDLFIYFFMTIDPHDGGLWGLGRQPLPLVLIAGVTVTALHVHGTRRRMVLYGREVQPEFTVPARHVKDPGSCWTDASLGSFKECRRDPPPHV